MSKDIYILGIESSCDDTGASIISYPHHILSNIVITQRAEHAVFHGIVPEIAARAHMKNLEHAVQAAVAESKLNIKDVDAIAATSGPGLIGGVIVGSMFGRALASVLKKPFIAINHLEGHILTARLTNQIPYPYLVLLVSGGHCQFVAVGSLGEYKILGQTIDDAAGEAFDKVGKMLGLPFPGGPEIEKLAKLGDPHKYQLPKPIIHQNNCDMSFSGLKTAVKSLISELNCDNQQIINDIAASFQYVITEILRIKLIKAIATYEQLCNKRALQIVIAGGVAANQYIINTLREEVSKLDYILIAPPIALCTDNAAMIAYAGLERFIAGLSNENDFCPRARWGLEELKNNT